MAIARQTGTQTNNAASGTSLTINTPTGTADGDLLVAWCGTRSVGSSDPISTPSGWTKLGQGSIAATSGTFALYYKIWHTGDPTTVQFTWTNTGQNAGGTVRYTGHDATTPSDVAASTNSDAVSGTTATALSITTTKDGAMLIMGSVANSGTTTTSGESAPLAEIFDMGGSNQTLAAEDGIQTTAGASGNKTVTLSTSKPWATMLWAIRPAVAAGANPRPVQRINQAVMRSALR